MLYDPKWEKTTETKADPMSWAALVAWLETMPADKEYDYFNCAGRCLIGQYMAANGVPWDRDVYDTWHYAPSGRRSIDHVSFGRIACESPHTFGAALKRARIIRADD